MKVPYLIAAAAFCFGMSSPLMAAETDKPEHIVITPDEFVWVDGPAGLPSGTKVAILEGDPSKAGPFTLRLKVPANYKIQPHWHPAIEHVTVLDGIFHMGMGDKFDESLGKILPVGSFAVMPIKSHHYAWTGNEAATIQLHGVGPWGITYVNPSDDPRKQKK
ncbi:cupin domain-containing protein [Candidatus Berkiella aquae]|uniref:Cupin domain-containing protein n=1 Tax=Candidatus Berkiella aquae TaxID=295108 RepID=A0A0Q9YKT1_9GAMM|nr:cupin domain-containing protein [Candidatus Berkiella aquae]MCS5711701.1 cupin domain-containing protein [Candidatus Berkiella aquae]